MNDEARPASSRHASAQPAITPSYRRATKCHADERKRKSCFDCPKEITWIINFLLHYKQVYHEHQLHGRHANHFAVQYLNGVLLMMEEVHGIQRVRYIIWQANKQEPRYHITINNTKHKEPTGA